MAEQNILEAIRSAMDEEMDRDDRVMVLGEDVGKKGGVFGATEGLWAKYGDKRVLDTPLTEGMIAGAAMGAAVYGLRPIAEMQFADFVYPAFNQIVSEISRIHYRSNGTFTAPMVIRMPYGGGVHGALYHSQSNEAYFTTTVGLKVVAPGTPSDAKGLLKAAIRDPDPVMFFEHKKTYRLFKAEVPEGDDHVVAIGSADVARPGRHLSIFCYGFMRTCALEAAETLAREDGVEAEVVDLRTLRPLDVDTILASVGRTGKALVVHEANRFGGFGAEIAAEIAERAFESLDGPVTRLAGPDVPAVPFHHALEDWFMIGPARIVEAARTLAAY
jgi:2-oxoisovalerate dehydrogenase E1 component beta subunit